MLCTYVSSGLGNGGGTQGGQNWETVCHCGEFGLERMIDVLDIHTS